MGQSVEDGPRDKAGSQVNPAKAPAPSFGRLLPECASRKPQMLKGGQRPTRGHHGSRVCRRAHGDGDCWSWWDGGVHRPLKPPPTPGALCGVGVQEVGKVLILGSGTWRGP